MRGGVGLSRVPERELEQLLRWLYQGKLKAPVSRGDLLASGLNHFAEYGDLAFGLDDAGTRAVLVAALAERRSARASAAALAGRPDEDPSE